MAENPSQDELRQTYRADEGLILGRNRRQYTYAMPSDEYREIRAELIERKQDLLKLRGEQEAALLSGQDKMDDNRRQALEVMLKTQRAAAQASLRGQDIRAKQLGLLARTMKESIETAAPEAPRDAVKAFQAATAPQFQKAREALGGGRTGAEEGLVQKLRQAGASDDEIAREIYQSVGTSTLDEVKAEFEGALRLAGSDAERVALAERAAQIIASETSTWDNDPAAAAAKNAVMRDFLLVARDLIGEDAIQAQDRALADGNRKLEELRQKIEGSGAGVSMAPFQSIMAEARKNYLGLQNADLKEFLAGIGETETIRKIDEQIGQTEQELKSLEENQVQEDEFSRVVNRFRDEVPGFDSFVQAMGFAGRDQRLKEERAVRYLTRNENVLEALIQKGSADRSVVDDPQAMRSFLAEQGVSVNPLERSLVPKFVRGEPRVEAGDGPQGPGANQEARERLVAQAGTNEMARNQLVDQLRKDTGVKPQGVPGYGGYRYLVNDDGTITITGAPDEAAAYVGRTFQPGSSQHTAIAKELGIIKGGSAPSGETKTGIPEIDDVSPVEAQTGTPEIDDVSQQDDVSLEERYSLEEGKKTKPKPEKLAEYFAATRGVGYPHTIVPD